MKKQIICTNISREVKNKNERRKKMKKSGRNTKYPKEEIEKAVREYLTTNKGAKEVEEEFQIPAPVIRYHSYKMREEEKQNEKN